MKLQFALTRSDLYLVKKGGAGIFFFLFVAFLMGLPQLGNAQESAKPSSSYPEVFARASVVGTKQCISASNLQKLDEVYLVEYAKSPRKPAQSSSVRVVEFFSGKTYGATLVEDSNHRGLLVAAHHQVEIDCGNYPRRLGFGIDQPINDSGHYFSLVNIGVDGRYGEDVSVETCQIGSHCDLGTHGLILRNRQGISIWEKLIAIRQTSVRGNPTYKLPGLYKIHTDSFSYGTRLDDGTALLTYDGLLTIRISLADGSLKKQQPDVSVLNIQPWAALKKILNDRFLMASNECINLPSGVCNWQKRTEMYFYSLRDYLFPNQ